MDTAPAPIVPVDQPFAAFSAASALAGMAWALQPSTGALLIIGDGLRLDGGPGGTRTELVDADPDALAEGAVTTLPYADGEFDCAVACDVLDQMPTDARPGLVTELARVSRRHVAILSPTASRLSESAEESVNEVWRKTLGVPHPRIARHRQHGLPPADGLARMLGESVGAAPEEFAVTSLRSWALFEMLECVAGSFARGELVFGRFSRHYNRRHAALDHGAPAYRTLMLAAKDAPVDGDAAAGLRARLGSAAERDAVRAIREALRLVLDGYAEELPSREAGGPLADAMARVRELERTTRFQERTIRKLAEELDFVKNSRDSTTQQGLFRRLFTP
jgi:hypothetical protein